MRYGAGHFFKCKSIFSYSGTRISFSPDPIRGYLAKSALAHTDAAYEDPTTKERTFYTFHFYLNDSKQAVPGDDDIQLDGGATSFLSSDESRRHDVNCKTGRVLIFQHRQLLHAGADVTAGLKYTVRSDLMFERV